MSLNIGPPCPAVTLSDFPLHASSLLSSPPPNTTQCKYKYMHNYQYNTIQIQMHIQIPIQYNGITNTYIITYTTHYTYKYMYSYKYNKYKETYNYRYKAMSADSCCWFPLLLLIQHKSNKIQRYVHHNACLTARIRWLLMEHNTNTKEQYKYQLILSFDLQTNTEIPCMNLHL